MNKFVSNVKTLVTETITEVQQDNVATLAASLAFFAVFSIVPGVLLLVTVVGSILGVDATRQEILAQLHTWVGPTGADFVKGAIENRAETAAGTTWAQVFGVGLVIIGSTRFFAELQFALNSVWGVEPKARLPILEVLRKRVLGALLIVFLAVLLIASILGSAFAASFAKYALPVRVGDIVSWEAMNFSVTFVVTTFLLVLLLKFFPDAHIRWRDVWLGAMLTALALVIGKFGFGYYIGKSAFASTYGAAGSIIVFLVFVYVAATILLVGAEFTLVWARNHGQKIRPEPHARRIRARFRRRRRTDVEEPDEATVDEEVEPSEENEPQ